MTRLLLLAPLLAACTHTPPVYDVPWPRTCEERDGGQRAFDTSPPTSKPVDDSNGAHSGDKSRDHNGGSSDGNSSDENGGKS